MITAIVVLSIVCLILVVLTIYLGAVHADAIQQRNDERAKYEHSERSVRTLSKNYLELRDLLKKHQNGLVEDLKAFDKIH